MQRADDSLFRVAGLARAAHPRLVPRVSRVVVCLLVVLGVGSSVVAWEDRVEATLAPAEIVAQIARIDQGAPAHDAAWSGRVLDVAPKTSPPRA